MFNVIDSKVALINALSALTDVGEPLHGVSVEYNAPAEFGLKTIYGGGFRFTHTDTVAETPGVLIHESANISLYIRAVVKLPGYSVKDSDSIVSSIIKAIADALRANPNLGGGIVWQGMSAGQGDYSQTQDEVVSIVALQITLSRMVSYA